MLDVGKVVVVQNWQRQKRIIDLHVYYIVLYNHTISIIHARIQYKNATNIRNLMIDADFKTWAFGLLEYGLNVEIDAFDAKLQWNWMNIYVMVFQLNINNNI